MTVPKGRIRVGILKLILSLKYASFNNNARKTQSLNVFVKGEVQWQARNAPLSQDTQTHKHISLLQNNRSFYNIRIK